MSLAFIGPVWAYRSAAAIKTSRYSNALVISKKEKTGTQADTNWFLREGDLKKIIEQGSCVGRPFYGIGVSPIPQKIRN